MDCNSTRNHPPAVVCYDAEGLLEEDEHRENTISHKREDSLKYKFFEDYSEDPMEQSERVISMMEKGNNTSEKLAEVLISFLNRNYSLPSQHSHPRMASEASL